jgi:hypothetical protein
VAGRDGVIGEAGGGPGRGGGVGAELRGGRLSMVGVPQVISVSAMQTMYTLKHNRP